MKDPVGIMIDLLILRGRVRSFDLKYWEDDLQVVIPSSNVYIKQFCISEGRASPSWSCLS